MAANYYERSSGCSLGKSKFVVDTQSHDPPVAMMSASGCLRLWQSLRRVIDDGAVESGCNKDQIWSHRLGLLVSQTEA